MKTIKKIEAIIRSEKLKDVIEALKKAGVGGVTVYEVRGFGAQSSRPDNFLFVHMHVHCFISFTIVLALKNSVMLLFDFARLSAWRK